MLTDGSTWFTNVETILNYRHMETLPKNPPVISSNSVKKTAHIGFRVTPDLKLQVMRAAVKYGYGFTELCETAMENIHLLFAETDTDQITKLQMEREAVNLELEKFTKHPDIVPILEYFSTPDAKPVKLTNGEEVKPASAADLFNIALQFMRGAIPAEVQKGEAA